MRSRGNKDQSGLSHRLHYWETLSPPPAGGAQSTNFGLLAAISWHWLRLACSGWPAGFESTCVWSSKVFLMVYFVGVCLVRKNPDFPGPEDRVNKFVSAPFIFLLALALKLHKCSLRVNLWGPQLKAIVLYRGSTNVRYGKLFLMETGRFYYGLWWKGLFSINLFPFPPPSDNHRNH